MHSQKIPFVYLVSERVEVNAAPDTVNKMKFISKADPLFYISVV